MEPQVTKTPPVGAAHCNFGNKRQAFGPPPSPDPTPKKCPRAEYGITQSLLVATPRVRMPSGPVLRCIVQQWGGQLSGGQPGFKASHLSLGGGNGAKEERFNLEVEGDWENFGFVDQQRPDTS